MKKEKNEILFQLGINYNDEKEIFKKGSVLVGAENRKDSLKMKILVDYFS